MKDGSDGFICGILIISFIQSVFLNIKTCNMSTDINYLKQKIDVIQKEMNELKRGI